MRTLIRSSAVLLILTTTLLTGCSDGSSSDRSMPAPTDEAERTDERDEGPANPNDTPDTPDTPDMPDTPDTPDEPAPAPQAVGVRLELSEAGLVAPGVRVAPTVLVDYDDGSVAELDTALAVEPSGAAVAAEDRYEIIAEGRIQFEACIPTDYYAEGEVCDQASLLSDAAPPQIIIDSPAPGARFFGAAEVRVQGRVQDSHGDVTAYLDGRPLDLDADGRFDVTTIPSFGINNLSILASDGVRPEETRAALDYLWAPASAPLTGDSVELEDGLAVRLGADFFDDDMTESLVNGRAELDDVASYVELMLQNADFGQIAGAYGSPRFGIEVVDATIGEAFADVDLLDDGFELRMEIPALSVAFTGINDGIWPRLPYDGTVQTSATLYVRFEFRQGRDGLTVLPRDLRVNLGDLQGDFENQFTQGAWDLLHDDVRGPVTERIQNGVVAGFVLRLASTLDDAFVAIDRGLAADTYELPLPGGAQELSWGPSSTRIETDAGAMTIEAPLVADAGTVLPGRDDLLRHDAPRTPFLEGSRVQAAIPLTAFNAPLHVLWASGGLDFDGRTQLAPAVAQAITRADVTLGLPPVVAPSQDPVHDLVLQLGQLEIELEVAGQVARFGAHIEIPGNVVLENGAVSFAPDGAFSVDGWVIETQGELPNLQPEAVVRILRDALREHLVTALGELQVAVPQLRFYPGPIVGAPNIPRSNVTFARAPEVRAGYLILDADASFTVRVE